MPIDHTAVGFSSEPVESAWDSTDALQYALGVGAGATDPTSQELRFTTEKMGGRQWLA